MEKNVVFINYPTEFGCYAKFERKVRKILSNMDSFSIVYIDDPQDFIAKLFNEDMGIYTVKCVLELELTAVGITHAIFFDDGESKQDILRQLESMAILVRVIPVKITKVVNVDKNEAYDVYIGRGTNWGNPYAIGFDGDRDEVIRKYQYDFDRGFLKNGEKFKEQLIELRGKRLGCHCKPAACHGDVLANYLNSLDDNK